MDIRPSQERRRYFPFALVGAIIGAFFIRSWPGQTERAGVMGILTHVGAGALIGEFVSWMRSRP
jgi:hypothetical protein